MMKTLIVCVALFALTFVHHVCADSTIPNYPPASQFQANVTFQPGLFDGDQQKFKGVFRFNADTQKYALLAHDSLRTTEFALFLENTNTQYIMSEFGEFGYDCLKYPNNRFTGFAGAFLPPFGFNMIDASYAGVKQCSSGDCDAFDIQIAGSSATLYFEAGSSPNRRLLRVETTDKAGVERIAEFSAIQITTQDDSYFQIPKKAQCRSA